MAMPAQSASGPTAEVVWTRQHVLDLMGRTSEHWPRYELVDGELLVTPAPRPAHQWMHGLLMTRLAHYALGHGVGMVLSAPADVSLDPERRSLLQPDIFVVPPRRGAPADWREVDSLRLVVEILSPSTALHDRTIKRRYYQQHGATEYWLVDLDQRCVERWRPRDEAPEVLRDAIEWQPEPSLPALVIDLRALFREVMPAE